MQKFFPKILWLPLFLMLFFISCKPDYTPKPRGFFRIDLPEKQYQQFDTTYPYSFKHPSYGKIKHIDKENAEPYWINLNFARFDATIHISYKKLSNNNLNQYIEDAVGFTNKQIPRATAINEEMVINPDNSVYGMIYHIEGTKAASTVQFFVTDSIDHFLRGALYFNVTPNNDSLAPVINFLKDDINYMIETLHWE